MANSRAIAGPNQNKTRTILRRPASPMQRSARAPPGPGSRAAPDVLVEEIPRQGKPLGNGPGVWRHGQARAGHALSQEVRQGEQPVTVGLSRRGTHRPAGAGRNVDQRIVAPRGGAGREVEAEAELGEDREFEPHHQGRRDVGIVQMVDEEAGGRVEFGVRLAFEEEAEQTGEMAHAVEGQPRSHQTGRHRFDGLDGEGAQALVEAGAPGGADAVAGLQHRLHPARAPAMHQPEMPSVVPGHEFEDDAGLALTAQAEHQPVVGPLHRRVLGNGRRVANATGWHRLQRIRCSRYA